MIGYLIDRWSFTIFWIWMVKIILKVQFRHLFCRFPERTKKIDLSKNRIKFINELPDLSELTLLNLTSNEISDIHYDAFDGLDSLETLVLSDNRLSAIDDDIFEWNPLKLKDS